MGRGHRGIGREGQRLGLLRRGLRKVSRNRKQEIRVRERARKERDGHR